MRILDGYAPKSQVNPYASSVGSGGGQYTDYDQWAFAVQTNWQAGIGYRDPSAEGVLYSEAETRHNGRIMLPLALEPGIPLSGGCGCHAIEVCGTSYMASGNVLYEWSDGAWLDVHVFDVDVCATGLAYFDGIFHVGNGQGANALWYFPGDDNDPAAAGEHLVCAEEWVIAQGQLFGWCCNEFFYTNGSRIRCDDPLVAPSVGQIIDLDDPDPPAAIEGWNWLRAEIGLCNGCDCITGIGYLAGDTVASGRLLITTQTGWYIRQTGDQFVYMDEWPSTHPLNGVGTFSHLGDVYVPIGFGMYRIASSGQVVEMGIDRGEGLPCGLAGRHAGQASLLNSFVSMVEPEDPDGQVSVWMWANSGWHFVAKLPAGESACGIRYNSTDERLHIMSDSRAYSIDMPSSGMDPTKLFRDVKHAPTGFVDLGEFSGGLLEVEKDFHSVAIIGRCITEETPVRVYWTTENPNSNCVGCKDVASYEGWQLLGTYTQDSQEITWPCSGDERPAGERIWLRIELETSDPTRTPVIEAWRLKYLPNVRDKFRWSYTIELPECRLTDLCNEPIADYIQSDWDCAIEQAVRSPSPTQFIDIDGREYYVHVVDSSRLPLNLRFDPEDGERRFDLQWSVGLLEVCPDPAEICEWESAPPRDDDKESIYQSAVTDEGSIYQ